MTLDELRALRAETLAALAAVEEETSKVFQTIHDPQRRAEARSPLMVKSHRIRKRWETACAKYVESLITAPAKESS